MQKYKNLFTMHVFFKNFSIKVLKNYVILWLEKFK